MNSGIPRPRKTRRRFEIAGQARFLTFSCFQRLPLFQNDAIKDLFVEELIRSRQRTGFQLIGWVVMPEHVHLMLVPNLPDFPVSKVLTDLKGQFSSKVLRRWRTLQAPILDRLIDSSGKTRFWQGGGGYDRNICSDRELAEKVNYMHNNPVARGLVKSPIDWRWSSARWYNGDRFPGDIVIDLNAW